MSLSPKSDPSPSDFSSWDEANYSLKNQTWGFRTMMCLMGSGPMFILLTWTPYKAYLDGLIKFPNILISDAIACSPWHRSVYTCGISATAVSSCVIYSEMVREIKLRISALPPPLKPSVDPLFLVALDQFLFTVFLIVLPNLLLLVSFMFVEDVGEVDSQEGWVAPDRNTEEFWHWLIHVVAATLCFVGLGTAAFLYMWHIAPTTVLLKIEDPQAVFYRTKFALGIVLSAGMGLPVRLLHIYHSRHVWSFPLLLVEVFALGFAVAANVFGSLSMMRHLDAREPKLKFRSLMADQWWATTGRPLISFRPLRKKHLIPRAAWVPIQAFEKYRKEGYDFVTRRRKGGRGRSQSRRK